MSAIKLGIVGVGKIARDQHLPVIAAGEDFELIAAASRNAAVDGVANYASLESMLDAEPSIEAVTLCAPPGPRHADAKLALSRGLHVLLEKPPASTLSAARDLVARASDQALHASWHSRHAPAVALARTWLRERRIRRVDVTWKEDIRRWHPGQDWILAAGGMGVFDPGINALSILTEIVPASIVLNTANLETPANRQAPISARLSAYTGDGAPVEAVFDFLKTGEQIWEISVETDSGVMRLSEGGARLFVDGQERSAPSLGRHHEYVGVYSRFAERVRSNQVDADLRPLELAADAFAIGERTIVQDFHF